jgi:exonuclease VII large subunit
MARKTKISSDPQQATDVEGNVDKIRDILFGGQMRDYDQRFAELEKNVGQSVERLGRDLEKRIDRLDTYARREIDKLTDQLKAEKKDRAADSKRGSSDLQELTDQVEIWFADVDEQLASETKDLRASIHEQHESLTQLIREAREQLDDALTHQSRSLAESKLAKEDLAGLLSEVALRLQNDFKLPKG